MHEMKVKRLLNKRHDIVHLLEINVWRYTHNICASSAISCPCSRPCVISDYHNLNCYSDLRADSWDNYTPHKCPTSDKVGQSVRLQTADFHSNW